MFQGSLLRLVTKIFMFRIPQKYADGEYKRDSSISEAMETPSIQALSNGNFVVAFSADKIPNPDGSGLLFGRHTVAYIYDSDFDIVADMIFLDRDTRENYPPDGIKGFPSISALKDGGFVVTWEDPKGDLGNEGSKTGNYEIEAAIYDAQGMIVKITGQDGTVQGTAAGDHMGVGHKDDQGDAITEGDDSISGASGDDTISAGGGNDTIDGGTGNDSLVGGTGNDSLTGGTAMTAWPAAVAMTRLLAALVTTRLLVVLVTTRLMVVLAMTVLLAVLAMTAWPAAMAMTRLMVAVAMTVLLAVLAMTV